MDRREILTEVFRDTQAFYAENAILAEAVRASVRATELIGAEEYPALPTAGRGKRCEIAVTPSRTFEAAMRLRKKFPDKKIGVLNFASAMKPGGGVLRGSGAQEESLCRCSTLYPTLDRKWLWDKFYGVNRAANDPRHTDDCIYSPNVVICKTDEAVPKRLPPEQFVTVDVISCAAPDLRPKKRDGMFVEIDHRILDDLHKKRAEHILRIAAAKGIDVLVLGAFGCGVFGNDPHTVASAWFKALEDYKKYFDRVEFAVYCRDGEEYENKFKTFQREKNFWCDDDVTIIDSGQAAREKFGELFGGFGARLSQEEIDALQNGEQLAIKVNDEYMLFLEGPER